MKSDASVIGWLRIVWKQQTAWDRVHVVLNKAVNVWGDVPYVGDALWWAFGEWQRFAPGPDEEPKR
jgi:hypothetical protein